MILKLLQKAYNQNRYKNNLQERYTPQNPENYFFTIFNRVGYLTNAKCALRNSRVDEGGLGRPESYAINPEVRYNQKVDALKIISIDAPMGNTKVIRWLSDKLTDLTKISDKAAKAAAKAELLDEYDGPDVADWTITYKDKESRHTYSCSLEKFANAQDANVGWGLRNDALINYKHTITLLSELTHAISVVFKYKGTNAQQSIDDIYREIENLGANDGLDAGGSDKKRARDANRIFKALTCDPADRSVIMLGALHDLSMKFHKIAQSNLAPTFFGDPKAVINFENNTHGKIAADKYLTAFKANLAQVPIDPSNYNVNRDHVKSIAESFADPNIENPTNIVFNDFIRWLRDKTSSIEVRVISHEKAMKNPANARKLIAPRYEIINVLQATGQLSAYIPNIEEVELNLENQFPEAITSSDLWTQSWRLKLEPMNLTPNSVDSKMLAILSQMQAVGRENIGTKTSRNIYLPRLNQIKNNNIILDLLLNYNHLGFKVGEN